MSLFTVDHIDKSFGGVQALQQVAFTVHPGEIFSIIGPNGAGKSTIFNCISGLYRPDSGRVIMEGMDITGWAPHRVAREGIARTFQNLELFRYLTAVDNLLLGRHLRMHAALWRLFGMPFRRSRAAKEEIAHRHRVEEIIEFLELEAYRDRPVFSLPYGVQKLLELGRALAMEPRLLLLDEPAAGLNNEERQDMIFWIKDIRDELGISVIVIEHNMQLVKDISDRIMALNFGKVIARGAVQDVLANDEVRSAYLGEEVETG